MNSYFRSPSYTEYTILRSSDETVVGTIRIKPTTVMWKSKGGKLFYAVGLEQFAAWITDPKTGARRLKQ